MPSTEPVATVMPWNMSTLVDLLAGRIAIEIAPLSQQLERLNVKMTILVGPEGNNGELSVLKGKVSQLEQGCDRRVCVAVQAEKVAAAEKIVRDKKADEDKRKRNWLRNWLCVSAVAILIAFISAGTSLYNGNQAIQASLASADAQRKQASDDRTGEKRIAAQATTDQAASDHKFRTDMQTSIDKNHKIAQRNLARTANVQSDVEKMANKPAPSPDKKHHFPPQIAW